MSEFTARETNFIKLHWVLNRMIGIYQNFTKISGDDKTSNLFRGIQRETIILQLHNFNIIRKELIKDLEIKLVDDCLEPFWKPIDDYKMGIELYRHNYIAHVQESSKPFKLMPETILDRYDMPTTFGEWLFRAGCVMFYCQQLDANFNEDWISAEKKYLINMPVAISRGLIKLDNYKPELAKLITESIKNLKNKGFKFHEPK